jgi:diguanylate cyclase (GGDEF)-like protein
MDIDHRNGDGPDFVGELRARAAKAAQDARRALDAGQTSADADQTSSDTDQTLSDADQSAAATDQASEDRDQMASDRDQATADRERAADANRTPEADIAYDLARMQRADVSYERLGTRLERATTARDRDLTSLDRDRIADARDKAGRDRDALAAELGERAVEPQTASLERQLELVRAQAAADRARAAADRERAAMDRASAARERARLEAELRSAHLDELTGAYRREMGRLALQHEIERARRSDGRFVLAFIDVDRLKSVNDRDGHAAGDRVLQTVVREIRAKLRSFDPIIRYGGDEFVCGLGGTDLEDAQRRFEAIGVAIEADARIGISVGLAALGDADTPDDLTERADAAMLAVKARHHTRD